MLRAVQCRMRLEWIARVYQPGAMTRRQRDRLRKLRWRARKRLQELTAK